ncbi:Ezrin/radixin/moesin family protein [Penaeicola halotolerans]|uniref:Ezrin/radixin/moesin family protein n=1 Tax=Penaeicola halotolerans TaxID=2793196 RepID=UPI001CF8C7D2|nr:Ezrin/radixin/moesin family protein [Penaeicola halotolerans]
MKKYILGLAILFACLLVAETSHAQMDKKERKEWKKKKKKMTPEDFKALNDQVTTLQAETSSLTAELSTLRSSVSEKDSRITALQNEIRTLEASLNSLRQQLTAQVPEEDWEKGVAFRVQIGAFKKVNFEKYIGSADDLKWEEDEGIRKYIVGNFRNYNDANELKKYLRKVGVGDAWIVPFKDGQRVPLDQVLDTTVEQLKEENAKMGKGTEAPVEEIK